METEARDSGEQLREMAEKVFDQLEGMGHLLAALRTEVEPDEDPEEELPTRLASQFVKMAVCLALVLNKTKVDAAVITICRRIMKDTAPSRRVRVIKLINRKECSSEQLAASTGIPMNSMRRLRKDMQLLDITHRVSRPNNSGVRGRHLHLWSLTPEFKAMWRSVMTKRRVKNEV